MRSSITCPLRWTFPPRWAWCLDGGQGRSASDDNGKFCSLAFKLWTDPFTGKLVFFRVYSGMLKKGDTIYNPRTPPTRTRQPVMMIRPINASTWRRSAPGTLQRWSG